MQNTDVSLRKLLLNCFNDKTLVNLVIVQPPTALITAPCCRVYCKILIVSMQHTMDANCLRDAMGGAIQS